MSFQVPGKESIPDKELKTLEFWEEDGSFKKSLDIREGCEEFVFYEGPPTANGLPHPGHILTRCVKDLFPRYKTMRGYLVKRKAGWDTHGLPVEIEVEKQLGLNSKEDIEAYGVENFIQKCRESVFTYLEEWVSITRRIGFWIDLDDPYITYQPKYIETLWWIFKEIHKKGLLYKGHKVLPYCTRCGTALSSHEVAQNYKDVQDPSAYTLFKVKGKDDHHLLAWTTTPWTLLSNVALAVHRDYEYIEYDTGEGVVILLGLLAEKIFGDSFDESKIVKRMKGEELIDTEYEPLFWPSEEGMTSELKAEYDNAKKKFVVIHGDFVSVEDGTGIVHIAPGYGEDDYNMGKQYGLPTIQMIGVDGLCKPGFPWSGKQFKDVDKEVFRDLKERKLLFKRETYNHSYPFCWRCNSPLVYFAMGSWFIKTTAIKDSLVANNQEIQWKPEHIRDGRFGNYLDNNIDWAISRSRFWGTPMPVWICKTCGATEVIGSFAELREKSINMPEEFDPHRPGVDEIIVRCCECGGESKRIPEVCDCWFDSGAMPIAQFHYPFENADTFDKWFPCDFISEAIDQTRGWFYTLHAIACMLFDNLSYKNCIVIGMVLGPDGLKMSKSAKNYEDPWDILNDQGADAMRWAFYSTTDPWVEMRFVAEGIKEAQKRFLLTLRNVNSFFTIYANIDKFDPSKDEKIPLAERSRLDRWIVSHMNHLIGDVRNGLDNYDILSAAKAMQKFVDYLSNWYVRRSRERFWKSGRDAEKMSAYWTLYEVLTQFSRILAPFCPFLAEEMYQSLEKPFSNNGHSSVHLCDFPEVDESCLDDDLEYEMGLAMDISALGRSARAEAKMKVRQPLSKLLLVMNDAKDKEKVEKYRSVILEELNIKDIEYIERAEDYVEFNLSPDFAKLGPKFGKMMPKVKAALSSGDAVQMIGLLESDGALSLQFDEQTVEIKQDEVFVGITPKAGYAAAHDKRFVLILNTELDEGLILEGLAREFVHKLQNMRKDADLNYQARIDVLYIADDELSKAISAHTDYIKRETLAVKLESLTSETADGEYKFDGEIAKHSLKLAFNDVGVPG